MKKKQSLVTLLAYPITSVNFAIGLFFFFSVCGCNQMNLPLDIQNIIKNSKNKSNLYATIDFFKSDKDSLKLKAVYFLIRHMKDRRYAEWEFDINTSADKEQFDVYRYFAQAGDNREIISELKAELLKKYPQARFVPIAIKNDLESVTAQELTENVEYAFKAWRKKWARGLTFEQFCEYILPNRIDAEPLRNWRKETYESKINWIESLGKESRFDLVTLVNDSLKKVYGYRHIRSSYMPNVLSIDQVDRLQGGVCNDLSTAGAYWMRAVGIPVVNEFTPCWGSIYGKGHAWLSFLNEDNVFQAFSPAFANPVKGSKMPPPKGRLAKIYRTTFSNHPESSPILPDTVYETIPGFLQTNNFIDVTNEYLETTDIKVKLSGERKKYKYAYIAVPSENQWSVVAWTRIGKDENAVFKSMGTGILYLIVYSTKDGLMPASDPFYQVNNNDQIVFNNESRSDELLRATLQKRLTSSFDEFKSGTSYNLYAWENGNWKMVTQVRTDSDSTLSYDFKRKKLYHLENAGSVINRIRPFMVVGKDSVKIL